MMPSFPHPPRRARTRPSTISSTRRTRRRRRRTGTTNAPPREAAPRRPPAPRHPPSRHHRRDLPGEGRHRGTATGRAPRAFDWRLERARRSPFASTPPAFPEGRGPLTLRWERGCARDGANGERSDARDDVSPATEFRTIVGAKKASYTCTSARCGMRVTAVVAGVAAGGDVSGGLERVRVCADGREGDGTDVRRG